MWYLGREKEVCESKFPKKGRYRGREGKKERKNVKENDLELARGGGFHAGEFTIEKKISRMRG